MGNTLKEILDNIDKILYECSVKVAYHKYIELKMYREIFRVANYDDFITKISDRYSSKMLKYGLIDIDDIEILLNKLETKEFTLREYPLDKIFKVTRAQCSIVHEDYGFDIEVTIQPIIEIYDKKSNEQSDEKSDKQSDEKSELWNKLKKVAEEYAQKYMNPHKVIVIDQNGIQEYEGNKADEFKVVD